MIGGQRLVDAMREVVGDPRIEELALPFTAVAVDMERQRVVWLRSGPLWEALRASFAIPGLFPPPVVHGRELVDGGLLEPMPSTATRGRESGVDGKSVLERVDLGGPGNAKKKKEQQKKG